MSHPIEHFSAIEFYKIAEKAILKEIILNYICLGSVVIAIDLYCIFIVLLVSFLHECFLKGAAACTINVVRGERL